MTDLDEATPTCDICNRAFDNSPNVLDYGAATEADWNGETGNHRYCELRVLAGEPSPLPDRFIGFMVGQLLASKLFEYPNQAQHFARKIKDAWNTTNGW